jgi:hypothetical protein
MVVGGQYYHEVSGKVEAKWRGMGSGRPHPWNSKDAAPAKDKGCRAKARRYTSKHKGKGADAEIGVPGKRKRAEPFRFAPLFYFLLSLRRKDSRASVTSFSR